MGQRAMVVDDVHRSALDGQRNAHLAGDGLEGVGEALEIGARGVASDAEPQAIGRTEEKREKREENSRSSSERTHCSDSKNAGGWRISHWRKPSKSRWLPPLSRNTSE